MKKIFLGTLMAAFALAILCAGPVHGQTWFTANQVTVAWDPVAKIETTDTIKYQVYLRIGTTGDGVPYGTEITATQSTITFTTEGSWFVGVRALRYVQGEATPIPSATISWSNEAGATNNNPFGIKYFVAPGSVTGLKRVP